MVLPSSLNRLGALRSFDWITGIGLTGVWLIVYLLTLAPGMAGGDAGEMQIVPYALSLAHPTGYPLHTLLGKLWVTFFPLGSIALRMNVLSAMAGALAVGLTYGAAKSLSGSLVAAIGAACALGASPIFWSQALLADKYALNACLFALVLFLLQRWLAAPTQRRLYVLALAYGFSLTHHRSMLTLAPFLALIWLWRARPTLTDPKSLLKLIACLVLPLTLYLYLPFGATRPLPNSVWHPDTPAQWLDYILDRNFLAAVRPTSGAADKLLTYAQTLQAQFSWLGIALGVVGAIRLVWRRAPMALVLIPLFVIQVVLTSGYEVSRNWVFFIPSFVVFALWIAEGVAAIGQTMRARANVRTGLEVALSLLLAASPFTAGFQHFRADNSDGGALDLFRNDLKRGYLAERFVANGLPHIAPNSTVLADWEQATPMWYAQVVEGQRPDVNVIWPTELLSEQLLRESTAPVYIARTYPTLGAPYRFSASGPLLRASLEPQHEMPANAQRTDIRWGGALSLDGYQTYPRLPSDGRVLPISLYFRALQPMPADYAISLRLLDPAGQQVWQEDRAAFALGMYPTSRWADGEIVGDYFEAELPADFKPGLYQFAILIYENVNGELRNLQQSQNDGAIALLPPFEVSK